MRQIPTGEFCEECPCQTDTEPLYCGAYDMYPKKVGYESWKRIPACLREKPQVLTEEDRMAIYRRGVENYSDGRPLPDFDMEESPDEHR